MIVDTSPKDAINLLQGGIRQISNQKNHFHQIGSLEYIPSYSIQRTRAFVPVLLLGWNRGRDMVCEWKCASFSKRKLKKEK